MRNDQRGGAWGGVAALGDVAGVVQARCMVLHGAGWVLGGHAVRLVVGGEGASSAADRDRHMGKRYMIRGEIGGECPWHGWVVWCAGVLGGGRAGWCDRCRGRRRGVCVAWRLA